MAKHNRRAIREGREKAEQKLSDQLLRLKSLDFDELKCHRTDRRIRDSQMRGPVGLTMPAPLMTRSLLSDSIKLPQSAGNNMTSKNPKHRIQEAVKLMRASAVASHDAALLLNSEILNHQTSLASEAAIIRDAAALLRHVFQNFDQISARSLGGPVKFRHRAQKRH